MSSEIRDDTTRRGRSWLLLSLSLAVAPSLMRVPLWLSAFAAGLIGWYLVRDRRGWRLPPAYIKVLMVAAGVAGIASTFNTIFGRDAGVALVALLLCMKLLELRSLRDAQLMVFIGYFLVGGALLYDQSLLSGGYLLLTLLVLTAALVALHDPVGSLPGRRYMRVAAGLLLQALPITVVLFVLFPRLPGPLWAMPTDRNAARTGLSDEISMGSISQLVDSGEPAFRVTFEEGSPLPRAEQLYWRGPVLWRTDGRRWSRLLPSQEQLMEAPRLEPHGPGLSYSVVMEPTHLVYLPMLDLPVAPTARNLRLTPSLELLSRRPLQERAQYAATSYPEARIIDMDLQAVEFGLQLPKYGNPRTRELAQAWRAEGARDSALVERALGYFRNEPFFYTRSPPGLDGAGHPVDAFLFESRRGFCEHYATAFVTLMRAAGVPARVVTGYQGGRLNAMGAFLLVSQSDAHAWAEVWLEGRGWVRVDPTAAVSPNRVENPRDAGRFAGEVSAGGSGPLGASWFTRAWFSVGQAWDALDYAFTAWVLGYDADQQRALLQALGLLQRGWGWVVGAMAAASALLVVAVALWLLWGRPRPRDPALRIWLRFCDRLARRGLPRGPGEGPLAYAERVAAARPELADEVREIAALYAGLRYGEAVVDAAALRRLAERVGGFAP